MTRDELIRNARFTVFLGKNGSGKSTVLRAIDSSHGQFSTKYISPERGGTLREDPGVETNMAHNRDWMTQDRRKNRTEHFRQQSIVQFRNLELLVLREIEKNRGTLDSFHQVLQKINNLLPAIELRRSDRGFTIHAKNGGAIPEDQISSGESELISLAIEVLVLSRESMNNKVLLLDEPDVHLHPDLQQKFVRFLEDVAIERDFKVVIATHSTPLISAFTRQDELQIVPITTRNETDFRYFSYSTICQEILPIFGAHPLSSEFNRTPILLVEGEDDKCVIDQFVRSSNGRVKFTPCVVGNVDEMNKWEKWLNEFLPSIYDEPKAFSLRDLDTSEQSELENVGCVCRARLNCYAIENLLLTNECMSKHECAPSDFQKRLNKWVSDNPTHSVCVTLRDVAKKFDERRTVNIKEVRNVLVALLDSRKPWWVVVGQLLADNSSSMDGDGDAPKHSLREYLGSSVVNKLLRTASINPR
ncbi:MAG: AAA family ATPase [Gammaproteobacteria bacterium]